MPWTTSDAIMHLRERHPSIEIAVDTLDGWRRHISGRNASALAFFGFLSIFPLMLAATTILGFVLQDNESLQQRIIDGAFSDVPVIGPDLQDDPTSLTGNPWALIIGLGGALWSATRAFVAIQLAQDDVWEIDVDHREAMPTQRGKALLGIIFIGFAQVCSLAIAAALSQLSLPIIGRILLLLTTVAINTVALAAMFRYLTSAEPKWGDVWPGAIGAGFVYTLLLQFGTLIVNQITDDARSTYGTFAVVLGLVTWMSLIAVSTLMCTELNAALVRRRDGSLASVKP